MNIKSSLLGTLLLCGALALPAGIGSHVLAQRAHATMSSPAVHLTAASTPMAAIRAVLGDYDPAHPATSCHASSMGHGGVRFDHCPITARLLYRLQYVDPRVHGGYDLLCQCQNTPGSITYAPARSNQFLAEVVTMWRYDSMGELKTYVVVRQPNGWAVDDVHGPGNPCNGLYQRHDVSHC